MTMTRISGWLAAGLLLAACAPGPGTTMSPQEQADFSAQMGMSDPLSNSQIPAANEDDPN